MNTPRVAGEAMLRIAALSLAFLLAGCGQSYVYIRADGQDIGNDPALYKQFETDSMRCQGDMHRGGPPTGYGTSVGAVGGSVNDCMATKGYVVVQSEVADLKRQDLAAKASNAPEGAAPGGAIEKSRSATGGTLRAAPVPRADAPPVFEQCTRISDKAARLACFDRATAQGSNSRR
jgi:hypothetical protein